jgi:spore germination protein YaaH
LVTLLLGLLTSVMVAFEEPARALAPANHGGAKGYVIDAWYPGWEVPGISPYESLSRHASLIDKVNPFWYALEPDGTVAPYESAEDPGLLALARDRGIEVMPLVSNEFDPLRVHRMLSSRAARDAHVNELVNLTVSKGYAGLDLDYEMMYALDRGKFSLFVEELASRLHAKGKKLSVAVHPKTSEPGSWRGAQAQDWKRIGLVVDEFKIMTYDYHWNGSEAGPASPLGWIDDVLTFAESQVSPAMIRMGLPLYGRDWQGTEARDLVHAEVQSLINEKNATVKRDASGEPYFEYGGGHTVYFQDAQSIDAKLDVLVRQHPNVGGIAIWHVGGEASGFWAPIKDKLER